MFSSKDLFFTPAVSTGYTVSKSLRFRSSASAYLSKATFATPTDNKKWTWSAWVKIGTINPWAGLFYGGGIGTSQPLTELYLYTDGTLYYQTYNGSANTGLLQTTQVFRDPSAWYHIVLVIDIANATANNRQRIYVNGAEVTAFSTRTNHGTSDSTYFNNASYAGYIGESFPVSGTAAKYFDGYMADINFIDGAAKTPTDFGAYDTNGVWQPAAYTGSYGTNGFYLKFTDVGATSGSNTGYGQDFSGNGNYWTTNNLSSTAGTTYDSMLDSPTNATGDIGNYAVWSPLVLFPNTTNQATMSNGNLLVTRSAGGLGGAVTTIGATSGKYYAEITVTAVGSSVPRVAVIADNNPPSINSANEYYPGGGTTSVAYRSDGGKTYNNSTTASWGSTYTTNDVIGIAFDADSGKVWFGKQTGGTGSMTWQASGDPAAGTNPANTLGTGVPFYFSAGGESGVQMSFNTGQRPLSATAPSGFSALNTQNLTTPTITNGAQYMAATLWTGNGTARAISNGTNNTIGTTFQSDFVWVKSRTQAIAHRLVDVVRGATLTLSSNLTNAEYTDSQGVTAFNSTGFNIGTDTSYNNTGDTYVGWNWKAGGTGVTNTSGTITSTVSANTTAGFSIVTWTGTGATGTIGHGLGATPSFIIVKARSASGEEWYCYHVSLGATARIQLNSTAAQTTGSSVWNSTSPTSTVFSIGNGNPNTSSVTYVAYCFAPVSGYSAFGSYTGNGSSTDGPFIYTGFRSRWILIKRYDSGSANDWYVFDTSRNTYNAVNSGLFPSLSSAEITQTTYDIDYLSNGFKFKNSNNALNASGGTYLYVAFAENPFKISRAR